jgi:hypothetical protein
MLAGLPTLLLLTLGSQLVFPVYSRVLQAGATSRRVCPRPPCHHRLRALVDGHGALTGVDRVPVRARYQDAGWLRNCWPSPPG